MSLYQQSVLKKHLAGQDAATMAEAYLRFAAYFLNPQIQENIRNSKEEQFQEGFLRELFVKVLGYTINPEANFNLTTELKNIKDAKKTDGAILLPSPEGEGPGVRSALAVIELKGTDTKDLDKVTDQAFNYKNNQPECIYVITSNFEKLRFYIHNAVEHEEFNLFALTEERFALLWLFLQKDNMLGGIPAKVKEESLLAEEKITKALYADYSAFKQALWEDMVQRNPQQDQLVLYKKSQKLLDRFLFILFAEDKGLLPPNSISEIVHHWRKLREMDEYRPMYSIFLKYFGYMDVGRKHPGKPEIHAYNGGLFAADEILDSLEITDELLEKHCLKLSAYNYESEVDTNILGHIFEHSLNDIENVRAQLEGTEVDKSKTKRKKDGVFYTPKYITKYIVENTVGKLCEEQKAAIGIDEAEFAKDRKGRKTETLKRLDAQLKSYRAWLLQLTICDPACGSGAFLNQALEFLMDEHRYIDELESQLLGYSMVFPDVENHILEKNIFGVDINEESVEIARLSLWLRTAKKGRKLTALSSNIKCGNSLIDDPDVAGDLAFNWQNEFPTVFAKGGFDVVIGNPPYLRVQGLRENFEVESKYCEGQYKSATGRFDIYVLFIERSFKLIQQKGLVCFILPHKFLIANFGTGIRGFLAEQKAIKSLIHFGSELVFEEASTYTCILTLSNENEKLYFSEIKPEQLFSRFSFDWMPINKLNSETWNLKGHQEQLLFDKLFSAGKPLGDVFMNISRGVVTGADGIFVLEGEFQGHIFKGFSKELGENVSLEADLVKPLLMGNSLSRYCKTSNDFYLLYPHKKTDKTAPIEIEELRVKYPLAFDYLNRFKDVLVAKKVKYKTNPDYWTALHNSRSLDLFGSEKIITPYLSKYGQMSLDREGEFFTNDKCSSLVLSDEITQPIEFFLGVLNSKLLWYFITKTSSEYSGGYFAYTNTYLNPFPIPIGINASQENYIAQSVKEILDHNGELNRVETSMSEHIQSKFDLPKPSTKLRNWPSLDFKGFLAELQKAKVQLTLPQEAEWMAYFNEQKTKANTLQAEINRIDKEIDQMVYQLYGLTEEEIKIVEAG